MPDIVEPDAGGEPVADRPDWLPDNFTDPQALVTSYHESQRKITEQGQQLSSLRDEFDSMAELVAQTQAEQQQYQQQPQYGQEQSHPLLVAAQQAFDNGDMATFMALNAQVQAEVTRNIVAESLSQQPTQRQPEASLDVLGAIAEDQLAAQYGPDWERLKPNTAELLSTGQVNINDPNSLNGVKSAMDTAFRLAHHADLLQSRTQQQADEAKREEARQAKLAAQSAQGGGVRPPDPDAQQKVLDELRASMSGRFTTSTL